MRLSDIALRTLFFCLNAWGSTPNDPVLIARYGSTRGLLKSGCLALGSLMLGLVTMPGKDVASNPYASPFVPLGETMSALFLVLAGVAVLASGWFGFRLYRTWMRPDLFDFRHPE